MLICIDSNQFIFGISGIDPASEKLMLLLPGLDVVIPRLVMKEVTRNLNDDNTKLLYALLNKAPSVKIIDEPVPIAMVEKYVRLGLPNKGDAWIGAFAEWQGVKYLISGNRHFLSEMTASFEVLRPTDFLYRYNH